MKAKTELLAPAKDKETAIAAIDCGADAVYMGACSFGARKSANNSLEDIKEVVNYAHKFWAKVFITVNTILSDKELIEAVELVKKLDSIGVDAILVQDMGLLNKLISLKLKVPIHMSTQCDNRDINKIKFFNEVGVSRVVLARELSLNEIKKIHGANPDLELEAFVHGALCVSYSGQCYLSQYIGGRSANRGECAQPCRKKYKIITDKGEILFENIYPLCLKDFNASGHLKEMIDGGIYSFKIEGRLKDIGYVKNITAYYRQELDKYSQKSSSGITKYNFTPNPEKSFNRGFTDYFLEKRKDCYSMKSPKSRGEYIGTVSGFKNKGFILNTKTKINSQDGLCYETKNGLEGLLVNKAEVINDFQVIIYPNKPVKISNNCKIYRNQDVHFEKTLSQKTKRQIGIEIELNNNTLTIKDEDKITSQTDLNKIEKSKNPEKIKDTFVKQFSKTGESDYYIKNINISNELPFMTVAEINNLRRVSFEKHTEKRLKEYKRAEQKELKYCPYYETSVDYRANVHNKKAEEFYNTCHCDVKEYSLETKIPHRQVELMRTKHCIKYALDMCGQNINLMLEDEKGPKYPLLFDCKKCEMAVLTPNI